MGGKIGIFEKSAYVPSKRTWTPPPPVTTTAYHKMMKLGHLIFVCIKVSKVLLSAQDSCKSDENQSFAVRF